MLVGRDGELEQLFALVEPGASNGGVLLLEGDPGIGKSVLLQAVRARAAGQGWRVLSVVGVEAEAGFPFAGLHQMLRPVSAEFSALPPLYRDALLGALGLIEPVPLDPFAICPAAAMVLAAMAAERPVLVTVDDVQWLDRQSREILAYLAQQVGVGDGVVIVGAARSGYHGPLLDEALPTVCVGGLDDAAATVILRDRAPDLAEADHFRIRSEAFGNPLALLELPAVPDRLPGSRTSSLSQRLEHAFAGRVADLPAPTRDLLLMAAIDSVGAAAEIVSAASLLQRAPVPESAFVPAEEAGLVCREGPYVRFRHPLIRSGIVQAEGLRRRQAAHEALAAVLDEQPYRRIWHRAQSIMGPDDEIADGLAANATVALARGAVLDAIDGLERAAQLTSNSARRGERLLSAAQHAFGAGRADLVARLLDAAAKTELSELAVARMEWLREIFHDGVPGDRLRIAGLCDLAERSIAAGEVDLALNLLLAAALRCWWADTEPGTKARVVRTAELIDGWEDPRRVAAVAVAEPIRCGATVLDILRARPADRIADGQSLWLLGMSAHAIGAEDAAQDYLGRSANILRTQGRFGLLSQVLSMAVMVNLVLGDLDAAGEAAAEGLELARRTSQPIWEAGTRVCEAVHEALRGRAHTALEIAADAELSASRRQVNDLLCCVQVARGIAWLAAGRPRDAYGALRRCFDPDDRSYHPREQYTALMFFADAAVRGGHREDAAAIVVGLGSAEGVASMRQVHLRYARAVLAGDAGDAEELYLEALRHDLSRWPLARAKTELAYGRWLRRRGRHRQAGVLLSAAATGLDRIDALALADEARIELHANGDAVDWPITGRGGAARYGALADLLAAGHSDGEIAERLSIVPRVVALYRSGAGK
ncbi:AAA family ATPase [Nocardia sp. NPDC059091]|uniref:AAA family ATPase n=1 Tax=unclassified Nocardia TaxID=2637762 RepID=UPI003676F043